MNNFKYFDLMNKLLKKTTFLVIICIALVATKAFSYNGGNVLGYFVAANKTYPGSYLIFFKQGSNPVAAEIACQAAEKLVQQEKYSEADAEFSKAIAFHPLPKYYCKRGACLMLQKKYADARNNFDDAIKKDSNYSEAYFLKATVFQFEGKVEEAIVFYSKAISVNPNYTDAYLMRGLSYGVINKKEKACADLYKAKSLGSLKAQKHIDDICGG